MQRPFDTSMKISSALKPFVNWFSLNPLFFLFLLSGSLRVLWVTLFANQFHASDTWTYIAIADNILSGRGYTIGGHATVLVTPVYPIFLAGLFLVSNHNLLLVQLFQAFLGTVAVLIVYLMARNFAQPKAAFWAGVIVAIHPWLIYWTGFILTETLFVFLLASSVLFFTRMMRTPSLRIGVVVGVTFGLASLCRPLALLIFVTLLIMSPCLFPKLKPAWPRIAVATLTLLLVMSPWIIRNYLLFDAFIPTSLEKGFSFYVGNNPAASLVYGGPAPNAPPTSYLPPGIDAMTDSQADSYLQTLALQFIYQNPVRFIELSISRLYLFWSPIYPTYSLLHDIINCIVYLPLYIAAIVGLAELKSRNRPLFWVFLVLLVVPTVVQSVTIVDLDQRFRLPLQPFLAILAAYGLYSIKRLDKRQAVR